MCTCDPGPGVLACAEVLKQASFQTRRILQRLLRGMGFPVVDVLSDENHYSEFVCKICLMLAEYAGAPLCFATVSIICARTRVFSFRYPMHTDCTCAPTASSLRRYCDRCGQTL